MKARLHLNNRISKKQQADIKEYCAQELRKQEVEHTRRMIKIMCVALHEQYGFGSLRLSRVLEKIERLSDIRDKDEVFWYHVDRELKAIGLNFEPEDYEKVDL